MFAGLYFAGCFFGQGFTRASASTTTVSVTVRTRRAPGIPAPPTRKGPAPMILGRLRGNVSLDADGRTTIMRPRRGGSFTAGTTTTVLDDV